MNVSPSAEMWDVAREKGISTILCYPVYQGSIGEITGPLWKMVFEHYGTPFLNGEKGPVVGFVTCCTWNDGRAEFEYLKADQAYMGIEDGPDRTEEAIKRILDRFIRRPVVRPSMADRVGQRTKPFKSGKAGLFIVTTPNHPQGEWGQWDPETGTAKGGD